MYVRKTALVCLTSAISVCLPSVLVAQAPVVDRSGQQRNAVVTENVASRNNYLEIQTLREEVTALRGIIEELTYALRKVQERQDEDYNDLDRRLSGGATSELQQEVGLEGVEGVIEAPAGLTETVDRDAVAGGPFSLPQNPIDTAKNDAAAEQLYQEGFAALRTGGRTLAVSKFQALVENYSGASREADALYWLGETFWLNLEAEDSRQAFVKLLNDYPEYRKADEAKYRLGLIYGQLGDSTKAIEYMKDLATGDGGQAEQAKAYLRDAGVR